MAQTKLLLCQKCAKKREGCGWGQAITHYTCVTCKNTFIYCNTGIPLASICYDCAKKNGVCEDCGKVAKLLEGC